MNACTTHEILNNHLKIGLAGISPFVYKENDEFHGSDIHMIKILSKKLGFTYNLKLETYDDVFKKVGNIKHTSAI